MLTPTNQDKGWSKRHAETNSNDWYDRTPVFHQPYVDVVVPESVLKAYRWQSSLTMLKSMPENFSLHDIMYRIENPRRVLDIACGIGRGSVYLSKRYHWYDTTFHMLDSTDDIPRYGVDEPGRDDIYNDMLSTRQYCNANGIPNSRLKLTDARLDNLDISFQGIEFDLAYSFMAFGFHWNFNHYLRRIEPYLADGALVIFGTRGYDQGSGLGYKARNFTNRQLAEVDQNVFRIIRDARLPERYKASLVILEKRGKNRLRDKLAPEEEGEE